MLIKTRSLKEKMASIDTLGIANKVFELKGLNCPIKIKEFYQFTKNK